MKTGIKTAQLRNEKIMLRLIRRTKSGYRPQILSTPLRNALLRLEMQKKIEWRKPSIGLGSYFLNK